MPACPGPVVNAATATVTCSYTGAAQYWTVPAGVTEATFTLYGGAGGASSADNAPGGAGAEVTGTLKVTPGSVLQVNVGQAGTGSKAFGGGAPGGGGASDVRDGAYRLASRLLVAGGGGGGGADGGGYYGGVAEGGTGGNADSPGGTGASALGTCFETLLGGGGGGAGTATTGGAGGIGNTSSCNGGNTTPYNGAAGSKANGGAGGQFGGAGGGGGYYGGGGGAGYAWDEDAPESGAGGGGGGASYTGTATGASVNDAPASPPSTNGEVIITYQEVLTHHQLSGHETAVSCLTASRCVAVGSRRYHGVVVTLTNGAQSHAVVLRGSSAIDSVSCRASGCWAIGRPGRGARAYLVKISSAGRPVAERTLALPAGTTLGPISCASPTSCEIAWSNNRIKPAAIEIGTWNGTRLRLYRAKVAGSTQVGMAGISCWHSDCEAVGAAQVGSASRGLILTISRGKPRTLNANSGFLLNSISCVSATTCYAAGGGVLVTVTDGVASNPQATLGIAIECTGSNCEAAGQGSQGSAAQGLLVNLTDGTAGPTTIVYDSGGFSGIATRAGRGFIAIGLGANSGSEDTVG